MRITQKIPPRITRNLDSNRILRPTTHQEALEVTGKILDQIQNSQRNFRVVDVPNGDTNQRQLLTVLEGNEPEQFRAALAPGWAGKGSGQNNAVIEPGNKHLIRLIPTYNFDDSVPNGSSFLFRNPEDSVRAEITDAYRPEIRGNYNLQLSPNLPVENARTTRIENSPLGQKIFNALRQILG